MRGYKSMYYIKVSENGKITDVLYLSNGVDDIKYLGWNKEEKEKSGAFVESLPEDYEADKYLYVGGEFVLNPDYVLPDISPTTEELAKENEMIKAQIQAQSDQMDFYEECIIEMAEIVYA